MALILEHTEVAVTLPWRLASLAMSDPVVCCLINLES